MADDDNVPEESRQHWREYLEWWGESPDETRLKSAPYCQWAPEKWAPVHTWDRTEVCAWCGADRDGDPSGLTSAQSEGKRLNRR